MSRGDKRTHLRLDYVARALPMVFPQLPSWTRFRDERAVWSSTGTINIHSVAAQELRERIACRRGYPNRNGKVAKHPLAIPSLGDRPTCPECAMLYDAALEAGLV